jgi:hypothetical protein
MNDMDAAKGQASIWTKIIAVCAILLVAFFGYSAFASSKNEQCQTTAMTPFLLVQILDTKWSPMGCHYLIRMKYGDPVPTWENEAYLDSFTAT